MLVAKEFDVHLQKNITLTNNKIRCHTIANDSQLYAGEQGQLAISELSTQSTTVICATSPDEDLTSIAYSPDSSYFVTTSKTHTKIWDSKSRNCTKTLYFPALGCSISPDSSTIVFASGNTVKIYDTKTSHCEDLKTQYLIGGRCMFSPNGSYFAVSGIDELFSNCIQLFDAKTLQPVSTIKNCAKNNFTFSSNSENIVCMLTTSTFDIWSIKENKLVKSIEHLASQVWDCCWIANSRYFIHGGEGHFYLWNTDSWTCVKKIYNFESPFPHCISVSDKYCVTSNRDSNIIGVYQLSHFDASDVSHNLDISKLSIMNEVLGRDIFGTVYSGRYLGAPVAIKQLSIFFGDKSDSVLNDFKEESNCIIALRHQNIIDHIGYTTNKSEGFVVMQYLPNGSLQKYIKESSNISLKDILKLSIGIANGINFLSTKYMFYESVTSLNVLLDQDFTPKLCDFGFEKTKQKAYATQSLSSAAWLAPEFLTPKRRNEREGVKASVFSFGVVIWEMVTRKQPWEGVNHLDLMKKVPSGERLEIPENCHPELRKIIQDCWEDDPKKRPGFPELIERLEKCH